MVIVLIVVLVAGAALTCAWVFNTMVSTFCPRCAEQADTREMLVPIIPLLRFWCPACNSLVPYREAKTKSESPGSDDDKPTL